MEAVYAVAGEQVVTRPHAAGPWSADMQHGSAPASLIAWAIEQIPAPRPMRVARLTLDLLRPVPVEMLLLQTRIVRDGRKIQVCEATLLAGQTEVVRASALRIRVDRAALPNALPERPSPRDLPDDFPDYGAGPFPSAFLAGVSMRSRHPMTYHAGPKSIWFRADRPIIEGAAISPFMRAALTADFCNGTGAVLDPQQWTFLNADLTVNLARMPVGDWIRLDAECWMGREGVGLAAGLMADTSGYFGRAAQSLVLEPRGTPSGESSRTFAGQ